MKPPGESTLRDYTSVFSAAPVFQGQLLEDIMPQMEAPTLMPATQRDVDNKWTSSMTASRTSSLDTCHLKSSISKRDRIMFTCVNVNHGLLPSTMARILFCCCHNVSPSTAP